MKNKIFAVFLMLPLLTAKVCGILVVAAVLFFFGAVIYVSIVSTSMGVFMENCLNVILFVSLIVGGMFILSAVLYLFKLMDERGKEKWNK